MLETKTRPPLEVLESMRTAKDWLAGLLIFCAAEPTKEMGLPLTLKVPAVLTHPPLKVMGWALAFKVAAVMVIVEVRTVGSCSVQAPAPVKAKLLKLLPRDVIFWPRAAPLKVTVLV